jgi:hypothetical protein
VASQRALNLAAVANVLILGPGFIPELAVLTWLGESSLPLFLAWDLKLELSPNRIVSRDSVVSVAGLLAWAWLEKEELLWLKEEELVWSPGACAGGGASPSREPWPDFSAWSTKQFASMSISKPPLAL